MNLCTDVDVIAIGGDLILNGSTSITAAMPGSIQSFTHDILLTRPLVIFRNSTTAHEFTIRAFRDFTCNNIIDLTGDASGHETILEVFAGTIEIEPGCDITANHSADEIHMKPTCQGLDCTILLGHHSEPNEQFHLTDAELDRISTEGRLRIGDRNHSRDVDQIHVIGVSFATATRDIMLVSHHIAVALFFILLFMPYLHVCNSLEWTHYIFNGRQYFLRSPSC